MGNREECLALVIAQVAAQFVPALKLCLGQLHCFFLLTDFLLLFLVGLELSLEFGDLFGELLIMVLTRLDDFVQFLAVFLVKSRLVGDDFLVPLVESGDFALHVCDGVLERLDGPLDGVNVALLVLTEQRQALDGHAWVVVEEGIEGRCCTLNVLPLVVEPVVPLDVLVLELSPLLIKVGGDQVADVAVVSQSHDILLVGLHARDDGLGYTDGVLELLGAFLPALELSGFLLQFGDETVVLGHAFLPVGHGEHAIELHSERFHALGVVGDGFALTVDSIDDRVQVDLGLGVGSGKLVQLFACGFDLPLQVAGLFLAFRQLIRLFTQFIDEQVGYRIIGYLFNFPAT